MNPYMAQFCFVNLGRGVGTGLVLATEYLTHYYLCAVPIHLELYISLSLRKLSKKWVLLWELFPMVVCSTGNSFYERVVMAT